MLSQVSRFFHSLLLNKRVLKSGGIFVEITYGPPDRRNRHLLHEDFKWGEPVVEKIREFPLAMRLTL